MQALMAGVDEVGRGPLAGPVITAAVILAKPIEGLKDSKQLTPQRRLTLAQKIQEESLCFAYGRAEAEEIDTLNIHYATLLAMKRAIEGLSIQPEQIYVDGLFTPDVAITCHAVVKADEVFPVVSAASILAKVLRDQEMADMDLLYPNYGFAAHKGYPTKAHREAIAKFGPCPIHRKKFKLYA